MGKAVVFPGSFDPVTNGHCDIILRGSHVFNNLILAVAESTGKQCVFTVEKRMEILRKVVHDIKLDNKVNVCHFSGLLVDFLRKRNLGIVVRGIRAASDFEYECRSFWINKELSFSFETVFFLARREYSHVSSSFVKELFKFGGDISHYVPSVILKEIQNVLRCKS